MRSIVSTFALALGVAALGAPSIASANPEAEAPAAAPAPSVAPAPAAETNVQPAPGGYVMPAPVPTPPHFDPTPAHGNPHGMPAHGGMGGTMVAADPHGDGAHGDAHGGGHHEDITQHYNFFDGMLFGYKTMDQAGGPLGDGMMGDQPLAAGQEETGMSPPFILMVANFAILVFLLGKFAWPRVNAMAMDRSDAIKTQLDEAAKLRAEAQAKLDEYSKKLADADAEMKALITQVRNDAEAEKQRVMAAATTQAAALKKDAETRIAAEIERARQLLAQEVAKAAVASAEQTLRAKTTATDQTNLVEAFIADLGRAPKQEQL